MGKKSKILYFSLLIVNVVIFILDLTPIDFPFFRISFGVSLLLIGALLVARAITLKIDSSLFIGITLFLIGVLNLIGFFGPKFWGLDINQLWPYYLFTISLASFVTAAYFKEKFQVKIGLLFLVFGLITLFFVQNLLNLVWYIILMVAWFVIYFVFNIIMFRRSK